MNLKGRKKSYIAGFGGKEKMMLCIIISNNIRNNNSKVHIALYFLKNFESNLIIFMDLHYFINLCLKAMWCLCLIISLLFFFQAVVI